MYMSKRDSLGGFELQVLLAVMRLGDEAYGVPIADTIEEASGREVAAGSIYITLDRLESKGFVTSRLGESTPERGGRAKTYFQVTAQGVRAVRAAQRTLVKLWTDVPELKGGSA
jgi:PadR family transcriptional regulator, regulatory protein PadR